MAAPKVGGSKLAVSMAAPKVGARLAVSMTSSKIKM
jgi:hypothetical protein